MPARDIRRLQLFASMIPAEEPFSKSLEKGIIVKRSHQVVAGIAAALGLALAGAAFAHPEGMQGMQHGMMGGTGHAGMGMGPSSMTPEERSAFHEKMRNAKTPEERQKLAKERAATLPKQNQSEHAH